MPEIACSPDKISIIIRYNAAFLPKFYQTEPVYLILIQKIRFYKDTFGKLTQELKLEKAFESHVNRIETFQTQKAIFKNVCQNVSFYFPPLCL